MTEFPAVHFRLTCPVDLIHPFWRYTAMYHGGGHSFLLDSGMDPGRLGRFSFLGGNPSAILRAWRVKNQPASTDDPGSPFRLELKRRISPSGDEMEADWLTSEGIQWTGDPFCALRDLHTSFFPGQHSNPAQDPTSGPLGGGLIGGFGYGLAHANENLHDTGSDDLQLPDMVFMVADEILALDHSTGSVWLTVTGRGHNTAEAQAHASTLQSNVLERLDHFEKDNQDSMIPEQTITGRAQSLPPRNKAAESPATVFSLPLETHFNQESYCAAVQKCRDHIFCGDVFEVCMTHRLGAQYSGSPWDLYQILRHINPAPFGAWLQLPEFQVASASPERFLNLNTDGLAESRPIKGTRPRGSSPAEDLVLSRDLATSEKDRAENVMIVDLVRNDLGKVCTIGSVTVPEMLVVEKYSSVFQLVSTVQGRLAPGNDAFDLVRACFPGGSMTGAPKIEAMQIIDNLEPVTRGLYSGAIGYIDATGAMDLNIVIRTLICQDDHVTFGVGGAVVADSDPATEYWETMDKAQAIVAALSIARSL